MIRAFFALSLSTAEQQWVQQKINSLQSEYQHAAYWLPAEKWHLTLCFLGHISQSTLLKVIASAQMIVDSTPSFSLTGQFIAGFPRAASRLIAIHIEPNAALTQLVKKFKDIAVAEGLHQDAYDFKPHITLARDFHRHYPFSPIPCDDLSLLAREVVLYESQPTSTHRHYHPLKKFAFR